MSFEIVGFERDALFRWSALLGAIHEFGHHSFRLALIGDQTDIGKKVVCARVADFGIVFRPDEVDRLNKTMKRARAEFPKFAWQVMDSVQGAADDARYASEDQKRKMI